MANKLSDILSQESSGIMFPFKSGVKPVKTEQKVYTPTEGIMNIKGTAYEGPSAVIAYGTEEQGYPRQLKEIEKGMLPQFDQSKFPEVGKGKIETTVPTTPTTPTQPVEPDKPLMDPCPPGFKLDPVKGICVPIEQPRSDKQEPLVDKRTNNEKAADILDDYGIKLTGEGGIFADPEKTKAVFGEFGELPTFTQKDFEGGLPFYVPFSGIINEIIKYSNISQLKNLGVINETSKGNYQLTKNGIRAVVQSSIDKDRPRMERELRKQGFTQKQIDSGQALAEMRKDEGEGVDRRVKEYQERESKKYTQEQKDDFMKKVEEEKKKREESSGGGNNRDYAKEAKEAREQRESREARDRAAKSAAKSGKSLATGGR